LDGYKKVDCIIVARGGGSIEDLAAFNTEEVARAVSECQKFVVSAVGHETDFTLCDFSSDLRAPTPSAAAELLTVTAKEKRERCLSLIDYAGTLVEDLYKNLSSRFRFSAVRLTRVLELKTASASARVQLLSSRLDASINLSHNSRLAELEKKMLSLEFLNPAKILEQGYAKIFVGNTELSSVADANVGADIRVRLKDGSMKARVTEINDN
jgi:exodeoxyribonuclease VII large subunit